jgi:hypothetical protein
VQKARVAYQGLLDALEHDPATGKSLLSGLRREIEAFKTRETRRIAQAHTTGSSLAITHSAAT